MNNASSSGSAPRPGLGSSRHVTIETAVHVLLLFSTCPGRPLQIGQGIVIKHNVNQRYVPTQCPQPSSGTGLHHAGSCGSATCSGSDCDAISTIWPSHLPPQHHVCTLCMNLGVRNTLHLLCTVFQAVQCATLSCLKLCRSFSLLDPRHLSPSKNVFARSVCALLQHAHRKPSYLWQKALHTSSTGTYLAVSPSR